mgnify:CR=1 FL=1
MLQLGDLGVKIVDGRGKAKEKVWWEIPAIPTAKPQLENFNFKHMIERRGMVTPFLPRVGTSLFEIVFFKSSFSGLRLLTQEKNFIEHAFPRFSPGKNHHKF